MAESSSWNTEQNRRSSANDTTCPSQKKYKVETDIANCFPSVYSHAVPWAAVGFAQAKKDKNDKAKWFNQLDSKVCWCKRNETNGVAIGPATSNIVVEAILAKVDDEMSNTHKFEFERYIDDYTAYCDTEEDAQRFLRLLGIELEKYKFLLNVRKTKIQKLPEAPQANWISQLILSLPRSKRLTVYDTAAYLGLAMDLASHEPDGSVLKYAVTTLASKNLAPNAHEFLLEELLNLSFHSPNLIPLLRPLFRTAKAIPMFLLLRTIENSLMSFFIATRANIGPTPCAGYYLLCDSWVIKSRTIARLKLSSPMTVWPYFLCTRLGTKSKRIASFHLQRNSIRKIGTC